jgi:oxygen-independent coproporphyrinogen III oxidase
VNARDSHHLYIHVPFCRLVCAYCDFVTVGGRSADIPRYVNALLAELARRPPRGVLTTIYLGGGTPSLLPAAAVGRLLAAARDWAVDHALEEVTVEANPSAREAPDWAALRGSGVDRISLGIQSLRDDQLRRLARGHTAAEGRAAFAAARRAGFENVSIDLIYGIPDQSLADWRADLAAALALAPDHLSLYGLQLALAPDEWAAAPRAGALRWRERLAPGQDDGLAADQYRLAEELLAAAGYRHYELSSWALPGRESRHNGAYWDRRPYTGIGAGAHSYDGARRSWNRRDLDGYLDAVEGGSDPTAGAESLDEPTRAFEAIALGLRRVDGLRRAAFAAEFGDDPIARFGAPLALAVEAGLLEVDDERLRLTGSGRLLTNEVLVGFLPDPPERARTTRVDIGPARLVPS